MHTKKRVLSLLACIALFFPFYIQAGDIKIGVSIGLTGKYSQMADMQKKAYHLWEESINKKGGLLGKKVKIIIKDDRSDKKTAVKIYTQFILKDKLDFVIGPYSSGITGAVMPVVEANGYPLLAAGAASDKLWDQNYKHLFGIFIPASRYAVGFLEMAAMNGISNIAIICADDPFSSSIAEGARYWGKKFGLKIVLFEKFKKGRHDLTTLAKKIKASNAKALIVCGHYVESVDMLKSFKKIKWRPSNYFATVGPTIPVFYQELGEDSEGVFSTSQWEPGVKYSRGDDKAFLIPFEKRYKIQPSYHAANAFASCQILAAAVRKTGSLNRKKIRNALSRMYSMSVIGRYGVDKKGMQVKHFPITIQLKKGKKVVVWPEEIATAKPVIK
ncbi:MAG: amino acid ABC transporter substrate-binding protein [Desulfobacterales bacterium]|nr:amino acid ABC transporter substrate-binding protein [Desulfobacterales bacterium]MCP4162242.1 amino acid ABC transporter substrate-binding protein [Deltaproteobacteria bacterium]